MKLEDQVVSLDLSKRLKELGFKQNNLFEYCYVCRHLGDEYKVEILPTEWELKNYEPLDTTLICSAYTVAELGEMLPKGFELTKFTEDNWSCSFVYVFTRFEADTIANVMAKMLIYLKENNLI